MRSAWRAGLIGAMAAAAMLSAFSEVAGAADAPSKAQSLELTLGKESFERHCASCHGPNAKGDGVAARLFTKKPPDLTMLAKNNGGKFPMNEVMNIVKGDQPIAAHGDRQMPVWGEIIGRPEHEGMSGQAVADSKIMTIATYLESIQVK